MACGGQDHPTLFHVIIALQLILSFFPCTHRRAIAYQLCGGYDKKRFSLLMLQNL